MVEGPVLPVVHFRIVCEEDDKKYPCDFCDQRFSTEKSLSIHICEDHQRLDIQDVYVCPLCRCCVLTRNDLEEHLGFRHQFYLIQSSEIAIEDTICEYCGLQLAKLCDLKEHIEHNHPLEYIQRGLSLVNLIELSLTEVWKMGMCNTECKTIFKVLEFPLRDSGANTCFKSRFIGEKNKFSGNLSSTALTSNNRTEIQEFDHYKCKEKANMVLNRDEDKNKNRCREESNYTNVIPLKSIKDNKKLDILSVECKADSGMLTKNNNQLILTVESPDKLEWNKDMVSKVLISCNLLKENKPLFYDSDVLIEKLPVNSDHNKNSEACVEIAKNILKDSHICHENSQSLLQTVAPSCNSVSIKAKEFSNLDQPISASEYTNMELMSEKQPKPDHTGHKSIKKIKKEEEHVEEIFLEILNDDCSKTAILELSDDDINRTTLLKLSNSESNRDADMEFSCENKISPSSLESSVDTVSQQGMLFLEQD
ncbi:hypothetical protein SK128_001578 [Halocaridina rubra]|uniref:C2H2-type domain-containing protein n=1 Tax=Halocaridina rubra TaxID=373956 RepID=A0AAN8XI72_HALRR